MEAPELLDKGNVTGAGSSPTCLFLVLHHVRDRALVSVNHRLKVIAQHTQSCQVPSAVLKPYLIRLPPVPPPRRVKFLFFVPLMMTLTM